MPALGPIECVTIACNDLEQSIELYGRYLGYRVMQRGPLSAALARCWGKPALAGRDQALLLPEGDGPTYLRFVSTPADSAYVAFRHMGWNAAEIMVQDTDQVAARLEGSPFKVIGPPANLSITDKIRAMQVLGPSQESLYLTCFKAKMAEFDVPDARHLVDRIFIVILGGASCASINDFYSRHLGVAKAATMPAVISVLSNAHGLPADTKHELAAIGLAGQCFIEADAMPPGSLPRSATGPELPPAVSIVSFTINSLAAVKLPWLAAPQRLSEAPYQGRTVATAIGPAGEMIELIER
jgi:catechol 2,3-dioxygenase-like lactoylglutathione lyase family enzyme